MPQDGRIELMVGGHPVDLACQRAANHVWRKRRHAEFWTAVVVNLSLDNVGMDEKTISIFRKVIDRPNGIILVTGPTGSGKTTTLYSSLFGDEQAGRQIDHDRGSGRVRH